MPVDALIISTKEILMKILLEKGQFSYPEPPDDLLKEFGIKILLKKLLFLPGAPQDFLKQIRI